MDEELKSWGVSYNQTINHIDGFRCLDPNCDFSFLDNDCNY